MTGATILYFPHGGGPLPLLDEPGHQGLNLFLRAYPGTIDRPDAIIVFSAHWAEPVIAITAAGSPQLVFDYHGFPPETYEYSYPAPGHPVLAERLHGMLRRAQVDARLDPARGLDHGVFVPLLLMYPHADIPCVQVSLSADLDAASHLRIGRALSGLNNDNLLVLGSGFSFHNVRAMMSGRDKLADESNRRFQAWLTRACCDTEISEAERERLLIHWADAPHARYCHPAAEHLLPLHVCYGIAQRPAKLVFQEQVLGFTASAFQWSG